MKKYSFYLKMVMGFVLPLAFAACSSETEPASDDLQPEATQGDYLGDDDLNNNQDNMPVADTAVVIE
ncbi:hypothetical protein ACXYMU_17455 [Pontibacter sp. CAU 1760]